LTVFANNHNDNWPRRAEEWMLFGR
jgi:hypothetical protein